MGLTLLGAKQGAGRGFGGDFFAHAEKQLPGHSCPWHHWLLLGPPGSFPSTQPGGELLTGTLQTKGRVPPAGSDLPIAL